VGATSAISAIRASHRRIFGAHEMLAARASVAASAKYPDLVYKVGFFHLGGKVK
jgi:hypothetical protein